MHRDRKKCRRGEAYSGLPKSVKRPVHVKWVEVSEKVGFQLVLLK